MGPARSDDSVDDESVDELQLRGILRMDAFRDGMWLRLAAAERGGREPEEAACFKADRDCVRLRLLEGDRDM